MTTRRGRRPGAPDTRAVILAAARKSFADQGFRGTTIRGVATAAGVDAALVHHYFGTKDDLFVAALALPVDLRERLQPALVGDVEGAAERLLRAFFELWDDPEHGATLAAMARGLVDPAERRLLTEGVVPVVIGPALASLGIDRPELRVPLVATQMVGLIMTRYVLRLEPLASLPADLLVEAIAPNLQRYLTGTLPAG